MPRACSMSAVVKPPIPPPTMMTFMGAHCVRTARRRNGKCRNWFTRLACGFETVEPAEPIDGDRNEPAGDKDRNDEIAEAAKIVVERGDEGPERAFEAEP